MFINSPEELFKTENNNTKSDIFVKERTFSRFPVVFLYIPVEIFIVNYSKKNIVIWTISADINNIKTNERDSHYLNIICGDKFSKEIKIRLELNDNQLPINIDPEKSIKCYGLMKIMYYGKIANELIGVFSSKTIISYSKYYKEWNPSLLRLSFFYMINKKDTVDIFTELKYPTLSDGFCDLEAVISVSTVDSVKKELKLSNIFSIKPEFDRINKLKEEEKAVWLSAKKFIYLKEDHITLSEGISIKTMEMQKIESLNKVEMNEIYLKSTYRK